MLEHGGNLGLAAKQYSIPLENWLDLSTGINPHGYTVPTVPQTWYQRLPLEQDGLVEAACAYYGCLYALPTAGSQAAIQVLPQLRAACRVAMPRTMYQEHAHAWQQHGHQVCFFDSVPSATLLQTVDVLLLCNPNNPTGQRYTAAQLLAWHAELNKRQAWLIVDEAFMDAAPEHSVAPNSHLEGLLVLRSLGKFFGLAGLRVGFLLAHPSILHTVQTLLGPWSLTGPSRYIARQALENNTWQTHMRQKLHVASKQLNDLLRAHQLVPAGGTALFQYVAHSNSREIHRHLAQQGVWVRLFDNHATALRFGLPPEHAWPILENALNTL